MAGKKGEKIQSTGIGESELNIAPEGSFAPGEIDWASCTINGQPIPEHLWGLVPYALTDQGRTEENEGKEEPRVQVLREPHDKAVEHYRDDLLNDYPIEEQHDPLRTVVEQHTPKGHRGLMMSEAKCAKEGMRRGVLDYEPVLDDKGQRIRLGGMFLGSVPEDRAKRAERYYRAKNAEKQQNAVDRVKEQTEQVMSEAKLKRLGRRAGEGEFDGIVHEDSEMIVGDLGREFQG